MASASTGTRSAEDVAAILESMLGTGSVHDDVAIMVARALDPVTA